VIDVLEALTRSVLCINPAFDDPGLTLTWTFTADEDSTLRQVHFTPGIPAILTTDPGLSFPVPGQTHNDFHLMSQIDSSWINLAFPMPRGRSLYWATGPLSSAGITLIFT